MTTRAAPQPRCPPSAGRGSPRRPTAGSQHRPGRPAVRPSRSDRPGRSGARRDGGAAGRRCSSTRSTGEHQAGRRRQRPSVPTPARPRSTGGSPAPPQAGHGHHCGAGANVAPTLSTHGRVERDELRPPPVDARHLGRLATPPSQQPPDRHEGRLTQPDRSGARRLGDAPGSGVGGQDDERGSVQGRRGNGVTASPRSLSIPASSISASRV